MEAFRTGMVVSALLMIGGGLLALAGIQNARPEDLPLTEPAAPASA